MTEPRPSRRRQRQRPPASGPAAADPGSVDGPRESRPARRDATRRARPTREPGEPNLRDLVGSGPSQLGVSGALRGRDVDRPTDADLAEAERTLIIVRRNWKPPS